MVFPTARLQQGRQVAADARGMRMIGSQQAVPGRGHLLEERHGLARPAGRGQVAGQHVRRAQRVRVIAAEYPPALRQQHVQDRDCLVPVAGLAQADGQELPGP